MHYRPTIIDRFDFLSTRRPLPPEERGREREAETHPSDPVQFQIYVISSL